MRIRFLAFVLALGFCAQVSAQSIDDSRWTFGATAGFGQTTGDEGSIGTGWLAGAYAERQLFKKIGLEFAADVLRNRRNDAFQTDGHTIYFSTQLVQRFGSDRANGFVMVGGALARHKGTTGFFDESFRAEHSSLNPGVIFGGGLTIRVARDIDIAPIVRMTLMKIDTDSEPFGSISGGIRIGFHR